MRKRRGGSLSEFRMFETDEFSKKLKKISSGDSVFLKRKLNSFVYPQLRADPFWGKKIKKLQGYRVGKFRIFYIVDQEEQIIYLLTVENRKDAYR